MKNMKVSLLEIARKKEVVKHPELEELTEMIRKNPEDSKVLQPASAPLQGRC